MYRDFQTCQVSSSFQSTKSATSLPAVHLGVLVQLSSYFQGKSSPQELLDDEDGEGDGEVKEPDAKKAV